MFKRLVGVGALVPSPGLFGLTVYKVSDELVE